MSGKKPRRKSVWTHTTVAAIEAWKEAQQISWTVAAQRLGVTVDTLRMWRKKETVPGLSRQAAVKGILDGGPATPPVETKGVARTESGRMAITLVTQPGADVKDIADVVLRALADAGFVATAVIETQAA